MIMKYVEARDQFLKFDKTPDTPSEIRLKHKALTNLRKIVAESAKDVLPLVISEFEELKPSRYVYNQFETCRPRSVEENILRYAYDKEEHTNYKDCREYMTDSQEMTETRESQWRIHRQSTIRKHKQNSNGTDGEFVPEWQYCGCGSYGVYRDYKGTPEFGIMMKLIGRHTSEDEVHEEYGLLLLLKELDCAIKEAETFIKSAGIELEEEKDIPETPAKTYKLHYELVQNFHDICENYDICFLYDDFAQSIRSANFKDLYEEKGRQNAIKCTLKHLSNAVVGSKEEQQEWYDKATQSIGTNKSQSRKGVGNLPCGFDEDLSKAVNDFYSKLKKARNLV